MFLLFVYCQIFVSASFLRAGRRSLAEASPPSFIQAGTRICQPSACNCGYAYKQVTLLPPAPPPPPPAAPARSRITLDGAKAYEGALKQRLYDEAARDPDALAAFLDSFVPDHLRAAEGADAAASTGRFSILNVATQMRSKLLFPALAFHLDSFRCLALFKSLLVELEEAQDARYPDYSAELQAKADEKQREAEQRQKNAARNEKEAEEAARDGFDDGGDAFVDVSAPHPEFVLAPPTSRLSAKEIDDILLELKRDTQGREELKPTHILVRALRRGFAIYIEDAAFSVYPATTCAPPHLSASSPLAFSLPRALPSWHASAA